MYTVIYTVGNNLNLFTSLFVDQGYNYDEAQPLSLWTNSRLTVNNTKLINLIVRI